ncbi:alpha/beta fold hydrolase [Variovorax humicola]|uniref:Alpha/beta fold hydrolase n=1 Tax=Variovorax humicola TaxID=1769758 RepID=A0ABU8WBR0_9BURK
MAQAHFETGTILVDGPVGAMEVMVDAPIDAPRGIAVLTHPQPLLGGNSMHKIPHLLAKAMRDAGWLVARPNFRGVGASHGTHDGGIGETDDVLALVAQLRSAHPALPLALVGFSFGAFVQSRVARRLADRNEPARRVVLAGMPAGEVEGRRQYAPDTGLPDALIVHGENDTRVALSAVLDWARPQGQPVMVVPGADHFFTGRLPVLRSLVLSHLAGALGDPS